MKAYDELASWWPLLSAPEDYAEEAVLYDRALREAILGPRETLLELGSGGGNNASHLKASWRLTLVDRSEGMLAVSRRLNPECEHHVGDMRTVRLGRTFDAVFIHDAICYLTSLEELGQALETAYVHTRPGGALLVAPDQVKERFRPQISHGGHDGDQRAMRYLEWAHAPDPDGSTVVVDYAFLLREADGSVRVEHDRHVHGLFARQQWLDALRAAGFSEVRGVLVDHSQLEPGTYELFLGRKAGSG